MYQTRQDVTNAAVLAIRRLPAEANRCAVDVRQKGHSFTDCHAEPKCEHCAQPHESNSKQYPTWHQGKQIQKLKVTKNISYVEARKLCQPTTTPSFATIVIESKSIQKEKFTQTNASITGLFCSMSKTTVSTLTVDNICKVIRPPKKKKSN
ncbi:hypothetical protein AVEN_98290-1 [Araneus ventricosus]|uniref:Uncharacterized protein n=1 Tax=Araneus ventricosus TaxID=182803 RepID=A0A4Y2TAF9_ARAVE|nr:hypothetical protein AVEN_98290-1 [Araneus ventricosus]